MYSSQADTTHSSLPADFPNGLPRPLFQIGDRVRWHPLPTSDFGIITGYEYAPAEHLQDWGWRYTIRLDPHSPSAAWVKVDAAWQDDLERLDTHSIQEANPE